MRTSDIDFSSLMLEAIDEFKYSQECELFFNEHSTTWSEYKLRKPSEISTDKLAMEFDAMEYLRFLCTKNKIPCKSFYFGPRNPETDIFGIPHVMLAYKQQPNGSVFFIKSDKDTDNASDDRFEHCGIIYNGIVYELISCKSINARYTPGKYITTPYNERFQDIDPETMIVRPTVINPFALRSLGRDYFKLDDRNTVSAIYVERVLGLQRVDTARGPQGNDANIVYQQMTEAAQWIWAEPLWDRFRGLNGPFRNIEPALYLIETILGYHAVKYNKFSYVGLSCEQYIEHICSNF